MFKLFQDIYKCGFNGKVKVKFKVKYERIVKKQKQIVLLSFVISPKFTKMEKVIIYQNKL